MREAVVSAWRSAYGIPMTHQSTTPPATPADTHASRLALVLGFTTLYLVAEVVGGLLTRSLALLADAAHMFTDVGGLVLALLTMRFAARPATPARTYGYLPFRNPGRPHERHRAHWHLCVHSVRSV